MTETNGQKLRRIRKADGLSQAKAAAIVNVSQRAWARYETGDREPPPGVLELFCIKTKRDYKQEFE